MSLVVELTLILAVSAACALALARYKQPLVPAYILAGLMLGPSVSGLMSANETLTFFADIGMAMLLFVVGLELNPSTLAKASRKIVVVTVIQVAAMIGIGFGAGSVLGLSIRESLILGAVVAFSSTVVVVKILEEKKWTDSLQAKLAISMMLMQDVLAIIALPLVGAEGDGIAMPLAKIILLFAVTAGCGWIAVPRIFKEALRHGETVILSSIALLFSFITLAGYLGFSPAIGGFLAGVMIAPYGYSLDVAMKIRPMRDFFAALFFVSLGVQLAIGDALSMPGAVITLLALVAVVKPAMVALLCIQSGYSVRTSLKTSAPMGQISEFSLIIASAGLASGSIDASLASAITLATMASIIISSYTASKDREIIYWIHPYLHRFEAKKEEKATHDDAQVVLIGCDRTGSRIQRLLHRQKTPYVVIDHNPDIIDRLIAKGVPCRYADASDPHFYESMNLNNAKKIISTTPSFEANLAIAKNKRSHAKESVLLACARSVDEAKELYRHKADYVILPNSISGEHIAHLMQHGHLERGKIDKLTKQHMRAIKNG